MSNSIAFSNKVVLAEAIAKSGLFGFKSMEEVLAIGMIAEADGLHFASAVRDYHIINGRPSIKAETMMARFQTAGGNVRWIALEDTIVSGEFSHPNAGTIVVEWTWERAKRAGLTDRVNKDGSLNNWQKYPRQMLRNRVISEAVRTLYPACLGGMHTPEETVSMLPANAPEPTGYAPPEPTGYAPPPIDIQSQTIPTNTLDMSSDRANLSKEDPLA